MAQKEAAFSNQHSAVSERQNQHQNQKTFTAKDAEDAKENKQNQHQNQRPFTTEGAEDTEKVNADEQARVQQRAEALALKLAQTYEELTRLLERNPAMKRQITEGDGQGGQGLPEAETAAEDGGHGSALPMGEAGRNELPVTADEAAHLLFCPHADGGGAGADAEAAAAGGRQRDPGWADADTEGGD